LPEEAECPIDNWIYILVEFAAPYFHQFGWTPNMITTLSNVFGILAAYLIYKRKFAIAAIAFLLAYVLDCLDGYVARKYGLVTVFGDYYDHFSDLAKVFIVFFVLWRIDAKLFVMVFLIYLCFLVLQCVHFGHQELYYCVINNCQEPESGFLWILTRLCDLEDRSDKDEILEKMRYTRHFGCGTSMAYMAFVILGYGVLYGK
jgi:hypothetical protein